MYSAYQLCWPGGSLFLLIVLVYAILQYILDNFRNESSDYLGFTGIVTCLVSTILILPFVHPDMETVLPLDQILAFQHIKTFKGYLGNIFALNPSLDSYFNDLQVSMEYTPQLEELAFNNIFKLEVSRCKLGYSNLESFIRDYNQNQALRQELRIRSKGKITLSSYRRNLKMIYPYLDKYARLLIQECRNFNLIGDKIWIWDRRFFECNCSGLKNKETGLLSDPDAGHYVKKTGKYSVLSGTGYTDTCPIQNSRVLPERFSGSAVVRIFLKSAAEMR